MPFIEDPLKPGIKFYRYRPVFPHEKIFLIDDQAVRVSAANLDNRSFYLNLEITASLNLQFLE